MSWLIQPTDYRRKVCSQWNTQITYIFAALSEWGIDQMRDHYPTRDVAKASKFPLLNFVGRPERVKTLSSFLLFLCTRLSRAPLKSIALTARMHFPFFLYVYAAWLSYDRTYVLLLLFFYFLFFWGYIHSAWLSYYFVCFPNN